ncbi:MAG: addiction module toxin, HicA family [Candidatus Levybacteria bacterium CG_4_10_14_0_8_um_filter_35_23]|nr:MAG: addiction module toxin, HicA family [Candidatus Levybacteria bacterium CG10_big_fil_rev_8_21_14_0_10_35_13]PIY95072.1 MAG: addiction module toxin, HicA family [Candidatus Levybacteria bacterium CG_4_10_14_0_8_um_filter_35_23]
MSNISPLPYREVIKKLRKLGFAFRRSTGGSHEIWWNEVARKTCVVPHHKEIKPGTLRNILRQAGISEKEFLAK